MDPLQLSLSTLSAVFYLWSLYAMRRPSRFAWALVLASLIPIIAQVVSIGAYPSLIGCAVGCSIAIRNWRALE